MYLMLTFFSCYELSIFDSQSRDNFDWIHLTRHNCMSLHKNDLYIFLNHEKCYLYKYVFPLTACLYLFICFHERIAFLSSDDHTSPYQI
jgi:hypothetical protein